MTKEEYLRKLKELLNDIDEIDRNEAIDYYTNYFDDAGLENEQKVIETLGSPEKLSFIIKDSLNNQFEENIEIGNEGIINDKYEEKNEIQYIEEKKKMDRRDKMIFLMLILVLCVPLSSILGSLFGIAGFIFSVILFFFGFWILTFALFVLGALSIAFGVLSLFKFLGGGLIFIGLGFILIAFGELVGKIASWFFKQFLPRIFKLLKDGINSLRGRGLDHETV